MTSRCLAVAAITFLAWQPASAQEALPVINAAEAAIGGEGLQTIEFSGWGSDFIFGQGYAPHSPWPRFHVPAYTVAIDYVTPSIRDDRRRAQAENPPLGGGFQPLIGEQRQVWLMSRGFAWDLVGDTVAPAAVERDLRSAVDGRTAQIWMTPHGFLKAARAGRTTVRTEEVRGAARTHLTVVTTSGVRLDGVLNARHEVEHVETALSHPVVGDIVYEVDYSGYRRFGNVSFPTRIVHRNGGYPVLDVTITTVRPNASVAIAVPQTVADARPAAPAPLVPERLAAGVWAVPGAARSVVVEFRDFVVVIDAPESEARSVAVLDAVRALLPGKPVRYVINTHAHFDHASGLRTYAAEGAVVVTDQQNVPFYQQAWAQPRTIAPDRLSRSGRAPVFEGVVGSRTISDGARRLVAYAYPGNMHNPAMLMVYLPNERILVEADSFTPPPVEGDAPAGLVNLAHFLDAVDRLRLDVEQVVPIHGRLATIEEARSGVATYAPAQLWGR